jgi:hypothetical protein
VQPSTKGKKHFAHLQAMHSLSAQAFHYKMGEEEYRAVFATFVANTVGYVTVYH